MNKQITREQAMQLLLEIGHAANITVPVKDPHGEIAYRYVLNETMVYNPYDGDQRGIGSNEQNAESALKFISRQFKAYSN